MRGEVTVQTVLVLPVVLGLLWLAVHAALLLHAGNIAAAAAAAAARAAARSDSPSVSAVQAVAADTARELGGRVASPSQVQWRGEVVGVAVTVEGPELVPFLPTTATRRAVVPIEQFLMDQDR